MAVTDLIQTPNETTMYVIDFYLQLANNSGE